MVTCYASKLSGYSDGLYHSGIRHVDVCELRNAICSVRNELK